MPDNDIIQEVEGNDCETQKPKMINPFAYTMIEERGNISLMTQREASYREPAEEIYNNKKLDDGKLFWESFRDNIEPPTPQIKEIDGYKSEEEVSGEEGGSDSQDQEDNNEQNG